jgi:threonine dehydratase
MVEIPDRATLLAAHERIRRYVHCTPVFGSRSIDAMLGARVSFKCENLQRGGAFKLRGALNAVLSLTDTEVAHGVATHSSGNHGAALAIAAGIRSVPAYIVVPENAPRVKRVAIAGYGATIIDCAPNVAAREAALREVVARTGAHFVPPYDDPRIVAGASTATLEFIDQVPDLEQIWVPVGGGGLASGCALATRDSGIAVVAAEPAGADDAARSLALGIRQPMPDPHTIADGLRTPLGELNFAILSTCGVTVSLASEAAIVAATRLCFERLKLVVEPSGAVGLAALREAPVAARAQRIGVIISGGNVDVEVLAELFRTVPGN